MPTNLLRIDRVRDGLPIGQLPLADEAVVGHEPPAGGQDKRDREIGDVVGQEARRVGDRDTSASGMIEVDGVEADADTGDDLEFRKSIHKRPVGAAPAVGDATSVSIRSWSPVVDLEEPMRGEACLQRRHHVGHGRADKDDLRFHGSLPTWDLAADRRRSDYCVRIRPGSHVATTGSATIKIRTNISRTMKGVAAA